MTAAAMVSGLLIVTLEKSAPANALLLSIAVTLMIAIASAAFLEPILSFLQKLEQACGVSAVYTGTMIKCLLISFVTRLGGSFCKDAGQTGMASMLELGGMFAAIWVSLPLFEALLSMLEEFV